MIEYLAFVDEIGQTSDGKYIYRFDFSLDKEVVWGAYWNIAPANLIPDICPDKKCLSRRFKATLPYKMEVACKNPCFSMQDCIDGVISMCFPDIDNKYLTLNGKPLVFNFAEEYVDVVEKLKNVGVEIFEEELIDNAEKNVLENFVEGNGTSSFGDDDDFDDNNDDYDDF